MNLRKAENYTIGLDLGTGSIGWAVVDETGAPFYFNGRPTLGSRIFPSAKTAKKRRVDRGQRRRYERRRQRLERLREIFAPEMQKVDEEFFIRMKQSALHREDRFTEYSIGYTHPFFNSSDFSEKEYYKKFPTIWHLRNYLMETDEKADIRLVYLALHNIIKYRGNFIREDEATLSAKNANAATAAEKLVEELVTYLKENQFTEETDATYAPNSQKIQHILEQQKDKKSERRDKLAEELNTLVEKITDIRSSEASKKEAPKHLKALGKNIAKACLGYTVEYSDIFSDLEKQEGSKFKLSEDEKVETFYEICPDSALPLFDSLRSAYSAFVLANIIGLAPKDNPSLSTAMIASYKQHKQDLKDLKELFKEYCPEKYNAMFKGVRSNGRYNINELSPESYTAYILKNKLSKKKNASTTHEELIKNIRKIFESVGEHVKNAPKYKAIESRLRSDDNSFLAKQKTRANGVIPFQLHLEEMKRIIEKQGKHYPFLQENESELTKLISSRIPYYVGPLVPERTQNANATMDDERRKFAWSVRKVGKEHEKAYPWNIDEVIDKDRTAEEFIRRMTGTCTYLLDEDVLPKSSLLYEEYCVLNELNGAKWSTENRRPTRFDAADRKALMEELFKKQKNVTHKTVARWLCKRNGYSDVKIFGTQGKDKFESKLSSYIEFCKILGVKTLESPDCPLLKDDIEKIISWSTLFEDKQIRRSKLKEAYEDVLTQEQLDKLTNMRCSGWGRLSKKFLTDIVIDTNLGSQSIIDILREGNPTTGRHNQAMVLMEILSEESFGFQEKIDGINEATLKRRDSRLTIEDMHGSPALRRAVNQAMKILDEIIKIAGKPPVRICLEVTREDDWEKKGKRTSTRYDNLEKALKTLKKESKVVEDKLLRELREKKKDILKGNKANEKLILYFAQDGKCLYCGRSLDINSLSDYQVDHIIPQCYIKDDSFDNKALVHPSENQKKLDSLLLDNSIIDKNKTWWTKLMNAKLLSEKKYRNLTCRSISDRMLKGFINRQLVETGQIVKFVRQMCEQKYPGTKVVPVKATLSSGLRQKLELPKIRELNDFHHAHDAFLVCQIAQFIDFRYPKLNDGIVVSKIMKKYVRQLGKDWSKSRKREFLGHAGFIIDSFCRSGFDQHTGEIFKDTWDAKEKISQIKRVFGYKNCYLSRMSEEQTGALWDSTIYSPHDSSRNNKGLFPLKGVSTSRELDPKKYGGYNKVQQAYFFIFCATDRSCKNKYFFEGVPVYLAKVIEKDPSALLKYAQDKAIESSKRSKSSKKSTNLDTESIRDSVQILRKKIPYRQKLELDGTVFYLGGKTNDRNEIRPALQVAVNYDTSRQLATILSGNDTASIDLEEYLTLYETLSARIAFTCPLLAENLRLTDYKTDFRDLKQEDKTKVIRNILNVANGTSQGCDLTSIGGKKTQGRLTKDISSQLDKIVWLDQSVTGMFERRTTFEELSNGVQICLHRE